MNARHAELREAWEFELMAEQQAHSTTRNHLGETNQQLSSKLVAQTAPMEAYQRSLTQKQQTLKKLQQEGIAAKKALESKNQQLALRLATQQKRATGWKNSQLTILLFIAGILGYGFKDSMDQLAAKKALKQGKTKKPVRVS